ncbi:MAG: 4-hydroxythreonine-4-phosphate dehydrogenase PdxA [Steroidobacteraceae bacterium]
MSTSRAERSVRLALTSGEPAGIGPELCLQLLAQAPADTELVLLADRELLRSRAQLLGVDLTGVAIEHHPLAVPSIPGKLDPGNARYVLKLLEAALTGIRGGTFDAMVTAPVQKSVIAESGVPFSGHTEFLAERSGASRPVMMLVAGSLRVALATTHLPLRQVPDAINTGSLVEILTLIDADLRRLWGLSRPRITVCGLNPHAGEHGVLGDEDEQLIRPAIEAVRARGIDASGPVPADTAFVPRELVKADALLAMYHDQGLPVLKHAAFGHAVNVTLGLPFIRTSVDHGTALALAGTGRADVGSLLAAVELARDLVLRKRHLSGAA